jgi:hypothetical protein
MRYIINMAAIESNLHCPSCQAGLQPRLLVCETCDIRVEGQFKMNEFATMAPEDLHFLRIFVHCEGRIRDMESALGLSYPTIRARLSALKTKLSTTAEATANAAPSANARVLERLQAGEITFDEAMKLIKEKKS